MLDKESELCSLNSWRGVGGWARCQMNPIKQRDQTDHFLSSSELQRACVRACAYVRVHVCVWNCSFIPHSRQKLQSKFWRWLIILLCVLSVINVWKLTLKTVFFLFKVAWGDQCHCLREGNISTLQSLKIYHFNMFPLLFFCKRKSFCFYWDYVQQIFVQPHDNAKNQAFDFCMHKTKKIDTEM